MPTYRNKTLRRMPETTRRLARIIKELTLLTKQLAKVMEEIKPIEKEAVERLKTASQVMDRLTNKEEKP